MAEITTAMMMPFGAARSAPTVSSDTWAEASKPVKVYCASSIPMRNPYQLGKPDCEVFVEKTKCSGCGCNGAKKNSATTIKAAPARCHHALIVFRRDTTLTPRKLIKACSNKLMAKINSVVTAPACPDA